MLEDCLHPLLHAAQILLGPTGVGHIRYDTAHADDLSRRGPYRKEARQIRPGPVVSHNWIDGDGLDCAGASVPLVDRGIGWGAPREQVESWRS